MILLALKARAEAARRRQQGLAWAVWHIEALARTKRLPPFERFSGARGAPARQSPDMMLAIAARWAARTGSTLED